MKLRLKGGLTQILLSILVFSQICCSSKQEPNKADATFFPLKVGQFTEYEIERTKYSITSLPETQHFSTKEVFADTFRNISNQLVYKIQYLSRDSATTWKLDSTSTCWQILDKIIVNENGQTVARMQYPLAEDPSWNGNAFNMLGAKNFSVSKLGKPFQFQSINFPKTVTITRQDDSTILTKNKYIEIYAENVGLVMKERIFLQYCSEPDCIGKGIIQSGWRELSVLKNYGK